MFKLKKSRGRLVPRVGHPFYLSRKDIFLRVSSMDYRCPTVEWHESDGYGVRKSPWTSFSTKESRGPRRKVKLPLGILESSSSVRRRKLRPIESSIGMLQVTYVDRSELLRAHTLGNVDIYNNQRRKTYRHWFLGILAHQLVRNSGTLDPNRFEQAQTLELLRPYCWYHWSSGVVV